MKGGSCMFLKRSRNLLWKLPISPFTHLLIYPFTHSRNCPLHLSRTLYKSNLFMQNKPNLLNAQMNLSSVKTMNYEQITMNKANKNKPNSNPIKPNSKPIQTQFKPNQTQSNPISNPIFHQNPPFIPSGVRHRRTKPRDLFFSFNM